MRKRWELLSCLWKVHCVSNGLDFWLVFLIFYEQTSIFYRDFKLGFFFKLGEQGFISQKNEWDFCCSMSSARDCVKDKYFLHGVEIVKFSVIVFFTTLG